jgi:segregation and condensation protein B
VDLKSTIESILFVAGRPVSRKELEKTTGKTAEDIDAAIAALIASHKDSGVVILKQGDSYLMSTTPENSPAVKEFLSMELREKLTDAALETLAIVTYKQPVSRAEIEAIRGVNSQYTLRLLLMRGLVERQQSHQDFRVNLYRTTHEFMQHLGLKDMKDLPDFTELTASVKPPEGFVTNTDGSASPANTENLPRAKAKDDMLNNA